MKEGLSKIAFEIAGKNQSGFEVERLWASHVRDDIYIVDNSPFQAFGVSWGDKIATIKKDGELTFLRVVERGGHSTYRIRLPPNCDHDYFIKYWEELARFGCTYEGASGEQRIYSIDVPNPKQSVDVYHILQKYEDAGAWEFEEAHHYRPEK